MLKLLLKSDRFGMEINKIFRVCLCYSVVKIRPFRYGNYYWTCNYGHDYEMLKSDRFGMEIILLSSIKSMNITPVKIRPFRYGNLCKQSNT